MSSEQRLFLKWESFEQIAKSMGKASADDFIGDFTVGHFRPKRPEEVLYVYSLPQFAEKLSGLFMGMIGVLLPVLRYHGDEIKAGNEELFVQMVFLKHEILTLSNAARKLTNDAQLFDIWQCSLKVDKRLESCLELTPGGEFKETSFEISYIVEGEELSWAFWAEGFYNITEEHGFYNLREAMEDRVRAVLALRPEENIKALERSLEEIERLQSEQQKLQRDNRGMLASLKKGHRR